MHSCRTTFDTTPMASHTVTLPSCEACINEEGKEGEEEGWGLQGVRWEVRVAGEPTAKGS